MRNVRPFWLEIEIDGRKHRICTGPRSRTGGFKIKVFWRNANRRSEQAGTLSGQVYSYDLEPKTEMRELFWDPAFKPEPGYPLDDDAYGMYHKTGEEKVQ